MKGLSKFARLKNGRGHFAIVGVDATLESNDPIKWSPEFTWQMKEYGDAVHQGVSDALLWHIQRGGHSASFVVTEFTEILAYTKPDAVRCAATTAAWIALGHDEAQLQFKFSTEWTVKPSCPRRVCE